MQTSRLIIDVREPIEYKMGHAEGALNIPPSQLMSGAPLLDNVDKSAEIIVYCRTGARSKTAIHLLQQMGFTNLTNGINAQHVTKNYLH